MAWRTSSIGRRWSGGRRGRNEVLTTIALIVDWYGPYPKIEDAKKAAEEFGDVLYLATGKRAYQRTASMQYVGISTDPKWRLNNNHHKLPEITKNFGIWLGKIGSQSLAGRRPQGHPTMHSKPVDLAEWVLAYFLQLPLNVRKRKNPPSDPVILISRWFKSYFETKWQRRRHKEWPDYIEFDPDNEFARLQWFGSPGTSRRLSADKIKALALQTASPPTQSRKTPRALE